MAHATACRRCSGPMDGRGPTAVFCSRKCSAAASKESERARMLAIDRTCEQCGCTFHSPVGDPPTSKRYPRLCGPRCVGESQRTNWPASRVYFAACADCGKVERLDGPQLAREWRCHVHCEHPSSKLSVGLCLECGKPFVRQRKGRSYSFCSDAHARRSVKRNAKHRRRGRMRATGSEVIYRRKVYDRDGGRCHLCRKRIDWSLPSAHLMAFTLDHVVPLSKGGSHTYANIRSAHRQCNNEKSDRCPVGGEQLMLIG